MGLLRKKTYISYGAVLVILCLLYIVMIFRINTEDANWNRLRPKDDITTSILHGLSQLNNPARITIEGTATSRITQRYFDPDKVSDKEKRFNSSRVVNKNVRVHVEQHKNVSILSDKKIVIIIAYMRSGSTLTASLLQQYPGTFYVFEPIRRLMQLFKGNHATLHYFNGETRQYSADEQYQIKTEEINNWFTCNLDLISIQSLTDVSYIHYTKYMRRFYHCANDYIYNDSISKRDFEACLKTTIDHCRKAPLLVLKFIRLKMEEIYPFLPLYPNMKIIHLVRDPRGILNSVFQLGTTSNTTYQKYAQVHCSLVSDNIDYSKRILKEYQDRLKIVHYEDIAERPLETARSLVEFAGVNFLKPMRDFIRKQTTSTRDSCAHCTQRKNSSKTSQSWRTELDPKYATFIDDACKSSNSILGYLPLTNVSMKDMTILSRKNINGIE